MGEVELYSWWFVNKEWDKLRRMPTPDQGFEESFREYLYRKVPFDAVSDTGDMGLGLSYSTLSGTAHELDVICRRDKNLFIFELKHYQVSVLTKEIVFTFLGKVLDFYFKNVTVLSQYKLIMLLVTTNRNVDESIRKLCLTYGIKLVEPNRMTLGILDYFGRDLCSKIQETDPELKLSTENLVKTIAALLDNFDYSFSDLFRYKSETISVQPISWISPPTQVLQEIVECHQTLEAARETWKSRRN